MRKPPITIKCECGETNELCRTASAGQCEQLPTLAGTRIRFRPRSTTACCARMRRVRLEAIGFRRSARSDLRAADRRCQRGLHLPDSGGGGRVALPLPADLATQGPPCGGTALRAGSFTPSSRMLTQRRGGPREDVSALRARGRPVLLATLEVPFDEAAAAFAVDAAVECGQPLIVDDVVEMPLGPMCVLMGYGDSRAFGGRGGAIPGPRRARTCARRRGRAAARTQPAPGRRAPRRSWPSVSPGLLVFGPDRSRLKPRVLPQGREEDPRPRRPASSGSPD